MANPHEELNRHRKAYKLHHVLLGIVHRNPLISVEDLRAAPARSGTRATAARIAQVRAPSDETWTWACDMVEEELARRAMRHRPR